MEIIPEKLGLTKSVALEKPLPVKHIEEVIDSDVLFGRMIGLMSQISKRTDKPITYEDEVLKMDNMMLHAFLRVAPVITKEEQRVLEAVMDEQKWMRENHRTDGSRDLLRTLNFVQGWKKVDEVFEKGGNIYDLLVFTNHEYLKNKTDKTLVYGYKGKLPDENQNSFKDEASGLYGIKDREGKIIVEAEYDNIRHSGYAGRGWCLCKEGKWGAVNERLEWMFPMEYEAIKTPYGGGHFLKKNGKWAYSNPEGKLITDFIYEETPSDVREWGGLSVKLNGKWGYIDENGKEVIPFDYDEIYVPYVEGVVEVKKDGLYGFYNLNDNIVIKSKYQAITFFSGSQPDEAEVKINDRWGVVDRKGNFLLEPEYEDVDIEEQNVYRVKKDGLTGKINKDKEILFPFKYKSLSSFNKEGIAVAQNQEGLCGYIDQEDNVIIDFQFKNARKFEGNYAEVSEGYDRKGVIDKTGKVVIPMEYDYISINWDGVIEVVKRDRQYYRHLKGLYDMRTGNKLPCVYESISIKGRDREGILVCRCKEYNNPIEIEVRVDQNTHRANRGSATSETPIAIARDFAVVLESNGWELKLLGHNPGFRQLGHNGYVKFKKLAAGFDGYMALTEDGMVVAGPEAREFRTGWKVDQLRNVIDISACEGRVVALHSNGTVTCIDEPGSYEGPTPLASEVRDWHGIKQVKCGFDYVVGLKEDGTLISCGKYYDCPKWKNIVSFDTFQCYYGQPFTMAILADGSVVCDWEPEVRAWKDVVKVSVGNNGYAVGLRKDGSAYAISHDEDFVRTVQSWHNIKDIECKFDAAVALLESGEIVCYPRRWME